MFVGCLLCPKCDYRTRQFLSAHHPFRPHDVVFQHQQTHALRIQEFPDDEAFYESDAARHAARLQDYFRLLEQRHAEPGEKILRLGLPLDGPVSLPCPQCREDLHWRGTGIA